MKFGETFTEYLHGNQERFLDKCSHVEYKRLKKVLRRCRSCKSSAQEDSDLPENYNDVANDGISPMCQCQACPICDQMFFSELMKEASDIAGCFSSRVRHLLHLYVSSGKQKYLRNLRQCFKGDQQQLMLQQGRMLIEYVAMNAVALRKILKKYDKVHGSMNGKIFRSKLRAEHIELLQLPWLIELGAFCLYFCGLDNGESNGFSTEFSVHFDANLPVMIMSLPGSINIEYDLTCAICLDSLFHPYALGCGHLFCKSCACSAASVMILEGPKSAGRDAKCPICREAGVYENAVHMLALDLVLKRRCKEYWKERMIAEREEMVKQSKEYWNLQTRYAIGYC